MDDKVSYTEWVNGEPVERLTPEERERRKKEYKQKKLDKKKRVPGEIPHYIKGKKEGMDLEKRVAKKWNTYGEKKEKSYNVKKRLDVSELLGEDEEESSSADHFPSINPAHFGPPKRSSMSTGFSSKAKRQPNSGALWHAKGDITLEHALMEVKERGTKNSRGEKQITIPKEWLTKQADEAFQERRHYWYIAFAYKGDEEIYLIKPYDHEIELVSRIDELEKEISHLKRQLGDT